MPHISIKPEVIFELFGFPVTNSYLTSLIAILIFALIAILYKRGLSSKKKSGLAYFMSFILKMLYNLFETIFHEKIDVFFPLLGAFFFYILVQNWFGLLPGVGSIMIKVHEHGELVEAPLFRGNNADLNTTLALGTITVLLMQYYGVKFLGIGTYIKKYINLKSPIDFALGVLEIISEISRILSFAFRLFGNIFAGEVLLAIIVFIVPIWAGLISFPFTILEIFVGMIQALVFTMLSAVFLNMAVSHH